MKELNAEEWYKEYTENDLIRKRYTDLDYSMMEQYAQAYHATKSKDLYTKEDVEKICSLIFLTIADGGDITTQEAITYFHESNTEG